MAVQLEHAQARIRDLQKRLLGGKTERYRSNERRGYEASMLG